MNLSMRALGILVAVQLVCCLLLAIAGVVFITATPQLDGESAGDAPIATTTEPPTATPTRTPTRTSTSAPTNTRVIPLPATITPTPGRGRTTTPTRVSATLTPSPNLYSIVVPMPTAAPLKYPVTIDSALKVVTYTVTGKTTQEMSKSLEAQAIADPHEPGSDYYAQTAWRISTKWSTKIAENNCELERADVSVQLTVTVPALTDVNGITPDALSRWNKFVANTITHEKGHVTRTLNGVRDYQIEIGNVAPQTDCNGMRSKLDDLFRFHSNQIDRVNSEFDTETNHGTSQGAVFP
ncbi:hypothetical protein ANRL3_00630 [Anaerolineae bacterium]|nr:hypothetical protein ANRL3_00630 [Anaerolineae bacterium]